MIFVSVGTHEQPFNRLMQALDKLIMDGKIKEQVVIQGGYSTYIPQDATFYKLMDFDIMNDYMHRARIVITHGGPATIIMALQNEKIPIVVPRQKKFDEHINNHQVEFTKQMADRRGNIIPVFNIKNLGSTIINYDKLTNSNEFNMRSNNIHFNKNLEKIVNSLFN